MVSSMQPRGHDWPSWQNLSLSIVFRNYIPYSPYVCSEIHIAGRSLEPSPLKVILRFLTCVVCFLLVAILLTGSSGLLSFFSLIISQVPFLARCRSLPVFPFSQTNLCFIPILAICFVSFPH